jgi:Diacylglycerol kinase catalytic domain
MARVALLSNPRSTGNKALLPRVRAFCAAHKDIFHYEVESVEQVGAALRSIARVKPTVLALNGGDGTVQAALTEIVNGGHFGTNPPPVAVLPNGKTNLIAHDLGAGADPIEALERVLEIARSGLDPHIVQRELIALTGGRGAGAGRPVLGMFLGGAGLADTMLYCRHKLYPLGLPNGFAHFLALIMGLAGMVLGRRVPWRRIPLKISVPTRRVLQGPYAFLMVTTLQRLLFKGSMPGDGGRQAGAMQLLVIEGNLKSLVGALIAAIRGRLGGSRLAGVHLERGDEIMIEGERSSVLLDGELFEATAGRPLILKPTGPMPFLRLAA